MLLNSKMSPNRGRRAFRQAQTGPDRPRQFENTFGDSMLFRKVAVDYFGRLCGASPWRPKQSTNILHDDSNWFFCLFFATLVGNIIWFRPKAQIARPPSVGTTCAHMSQEFAAPRFIQIRPRGPDLLFALGLLLLPGLSISRET